MRDSGLVFFALVWLSRLALADEPAELKTSPLAKAFGTAPVRGREN